jgi:hypothetical protein
VLKPAIACKVFSYSRYPFDFEIGGRNQKTQLCFKICVGGGVAFLEAVREVLEFFCAMLFPKDASFAPFSKVDVLAPPTTLPKSRAFPADFGAFAEPNEAKAPEPRPNALEAPAVGDDMPAVGEGSALKGFDFPPWEDVSPPKRLEGV